MKRRNSRRNFDVGYYRRTLNNFVQIFYFYSIITGAFCVAELVEDDDTTTPKPIYKYYYGAKSSSTFITPCTYPTPTNTPSWQTCNVEHETANKYNICDPESTIYFSTREALDKKMDDIFKKHGEMCVCENEKPTHSCWYQFAFAFINELGQPDHQLPEDIRAEELCDDDLHKPTRLPKRETFNHSWWFNRTKVEAYGKKFAEILSERWNLGMCSEGLLILVVKNGPITLMNSKTEPRKPVVFVHFGNLVVHKTQHLTAPENFEIKSMDEAVSRVNEMLQSNGENSTLDRALVTLISWHEQMLMLADHTYHDFSPEVKTPFRSHIPNWALGVFAGCGLLLLIMGAGMGLVRTRARRVGVRGKQNNEQSRKWKAGFVGGMFKRGGDSANGGGGNSGYTGLDVRIEYK